MNTPLIFWIVPAASVVALAVAWIFYTRMKREDEGTVQKIKGVFIAVVDN